LGVPPRAFYVAAVGSGFSFANLAVALPLYALATGHSASLAGGLLGVQTCGIAAGALAAGALGGPARRYALSVGLAVMALGQAGLLVAPAGAALMAGAVVHGAGMGLFWVGTQALLAARAGEHGSQRVFVRQYVLYVVGTASGAAATGAGAALLEASGLSRAASIRGTFVLALAAAAVAAHACRHVRGTTVARAHRPVSPRWGLSVQVPDLLLVAGIALLLSLSPIVLRSTFRFSSVEIGMVAALVAAAKIAGSFVADRLVGSAGSRLAVLAMLATAAPLMLVLAETRTASVFVLLLLSAALLTTGVWPVLVDAAHARISPDERSNLAVAWNVREYLVIAAATSAGGWALSAFAGPTVPLLVAGALVGSAAWASAAVLRSPLYELA
jgi:MFS family permease